ncbi:MAG: hypothetical protein ACKVJ2_13440 [Pseudomonadales bacterium]
MAIASWRTLYLHDIHVNAERTVWFFDNTVAFSDSAQLSINKGTTDSLSLASLAPTFTVGLTKSDNFNVIDSTRISYGKVVLDPVSFGDSLTFGSGKTISDSLGFSESVHTLLTYIRSFSHAVPMTDSLSLQSGKTATDSITLPDTVALAPNKGLADSSSISDTPTIATSKSLSHPIYFYGSLVATRQPYNFIFSETAGVVSVTGEPTDSVSFSDETPAFNVGVSLQNYFALDDFAQVDKDVGGVKTNIVGFTETLGFGLDKSIPNQYISLTDEQLFALSKASSDSIMVSESLALSASKSANDSTTLTDASTLSSWIGKSDGISIADSIDYEHVITNALLNQSLLGNMILNAE